MHKHAVGCADTCTMRIAALQGLAKTAAHHVDEPAPVLDAADEGLPPRLVRCECRTCGAHTNAVASVGGRASCPNCGGRTLVPLEGAGLIEPDQR